MHTSTKVRNIYENREIVTQPGKSTRVVLNHVMKQEHTIEETINQNWLKTDTGVRISRIKDIKAVRILEFHMSQKLGKCWRKEIHHIHRDESCNIWNENLVCGKKATKISKT